MIGRHILLYAHSYTYRLYTQPNTSIKLNACGKLHLSPSPFQTAWGGGVTWPLAPFPALTLETRHIFSFFVLSRIHE